MRKQECISKNPHIFESYFLRNECTKCGGKTSENLVFFRKGHVIPIWKFYKKNKKWLCYFEVAIFIISLYIKNLLQSDNFNINNKNVIPSKFILVFEIQIKRKMCNTVKIYFYFEMFTVSSLDYRYSKLNNVKNE